VRVLQAKEKMTTRQEQAAETRSNLLDAALKLFAENGYNATTVRSINHNAGVADGLLYHYFPEGKKEILQVLVTEQIAEMKPRLSAGAEQLDGLSLEDAIEKIYQICFEVFREFKFVLRILLRENELMKRIKREQLAEIIGSDHRLFSKLLRKRAQTGEINEIDYDSAEEILNAILFSYCLTILTGIGSKILNYTEHRKKLIAYEVGLWKGIHP
jgi:AcrR family transcriptional regulator